MDSKQLQTKADEMAYAIVNALIGAGFERPFPERRFIDALAAVSDVVLVSIEKAAAEEEKRKGRGIVLVGGPAAGRREAVPGEYEVFNVKVPRDLPEDLKMALSLRRAEPHYDTAQYRREALYCGTERVVEFMVDCGLTTQAALRELVRGYKGEPKP